MTILPGPFGFSSALVLCALMTAAGADNADAAGFGTPLVGKVENRIVQKIGGQCTRLIRRAGRETLVNTCNTCRMVSVTRKRPGIPAPVHREFSLAAKSQFPVPFRGPGSSRITSDIPCKGERDESAGSGNSPQDQNCVVLKQNPRGEVLLVNSCHTCRGVAINRISRTGKSLGLQAYKMKSQSAVRVAPKGAVSVRIDGEVACPG